MKVYIEFDLPGESNEYYHAAKGLEYYRAILGIERAVSGELDDADKLSEIKNRLIDIGYDFSK